MLPILEIVKLVTTPTTRLIVAPHAHPVVLTTVRRVLTIPRVQHVSLDIKRIQTSATIVVLAAAWHVL